MNITYVILSHSKNNAHNRLDTFRHIYSKPNEFLLRFWPVSHLMKACTHMLHTVHISYLCRLGQFFRIQDIVQQRTFCVSVQYSFQNLSNC